MVLNQSKETALEKWKYLMDHPEDLLYAGMPAWLLYKLSAFAFEDPLCEHFFEPGCHCPKCPIGSCYGGIFENWILAGFNDDYKRAKEAAQIIINRIEAWSPKS